MNKQRLRELADTIEANADSFDLSEYFYVHDEDNTLARPWVQGDSVPDPHDCGTTACIAGWAYKMYDEDQDAEVFEQVRIRAAYLMGFEPDDPTWRKVTADYEYPAYVATFWDGHTEAAEDGGFLAAEQVTAQEAANMLRAVADGYRGPE